MVVKYIQTSWVNLNENVFVFGHIEFNLFLPVFLSALLYFFEFVFQCEDVFVLLRGCMFCIICMFRLRLLVFAVGFVFAALAGDERFSQLRDGSDEFRLILLTCSLWLVGRICGVGVGVAQSTVLLMFWK